MPPLIDPAGEPETEFFTVMPVRDLPPTEPFRTSCMGNNFRRRLWQRCCWYHRQDWTAVSERAIELLASANAAGHHFASDVADHVWASDALGGKRLGALPELFSLANAIQVGPSNTYTNGQHRAQAMKDLGVERTVVMRW